MKTILKTKLFTLLKLATLAACFSVAGLFSSDLSAQDPIATDYQDAFKSIAKYTSGGADRTTRLLRNYNFDPARHLPTHLQKDWAKFPAVRKLEMAFEAAENASKGSGEKLLANLSKDLAQRYQAVRSERALSPIMEKADGAKAFDFKMPAANSDVSRLSPNTQKQILSISKYTERGALGGTRGVLKYKFGLPDAQVYEILRTSGSNEQALQRGLSSAKVPPPPEQRLYRVARDIQKNYQAARQDVELKKMADAGVESPPKSSAAPKSRKVSDGFIKDVDRPRTNSPASAPQPGTRNKARYDSFVKQNYQSRSARKFSSMRIKRSGFGGVIFGNEVTVAPDMPRLDYFHWIPTNFDEAEGPAAGYLEFIFEDGGEYIVPAVLLEDIVAANEIVNNAAYGFEEGDGVGLAGIENNLIYPDSAIRWEVVLHPAIANLELGWSALMADVLPIASQKTLELIEANSSEDDYLMSALFFSLLTPDTWKITDVPLQISRSEGELLLARGDYPAEERIEGAYLTMQAFTDDVEGEEWTSFHAIVPSLVRSIYEYERINDFARVMALFRWAKTQGAEFIRPETNLRYVNSPETIFITNDRQVAFLTTAEEQGALNDMLENTQQRMRSLATHAELAAVHQNFRVANEKLTNEYGAMWQRILNTGDNGLLSIADCSFVMEEPDSILKLSNLLEGLPADSKIATLATQYAELEEMEQTLMEAELARIIYLSQADSIIRTDAPEQLEAFQSLMAEYEAIKYEEDLTEEEVDSKRETILGKMDDVMVEVNSDFFLLILFKNYAIEAIAELEPQVAALEEELPSFRAWHEQYQMVKNVLRTEKAVLERLQAQRCPN